jgi:hypothetical protein
MYLILTILTERHFEVLKPWKNLSPGLDGSMAKLDAELNAEPRWLNAEPRWLDGGLDGLMGATLLNRLLIIAPVAGQWPVFTIKFLLQAPTQSVARPMGSNFLI